jgi:serine acetyltransferase
MYREPDGGPTIPELGFAQLVWSDYRGCRIAKEPAWLAAVLLVPRFLINPSLLFALLVRAAQTAPRPLLYLVRWLQVMLFSSEIYWFKGEGAIEIGPGVSFPHPFNIVIGPGTRIGSDVTIYNNTSIGADRHWVPGQPTDRACSLGDRCVIYHYATVQGPFTIGADAVVGHHAIVTEDVPPGALLTHRKLRERHEWDGEYRPRQARG